MADPRIPIVDDDDDVRRGPNLLRRANGYATVFAGDGVGAVSMPREERPDPVVLDLGLPPGDAPVPRFTPRSRPRTRRCWARSRRR